jgi:hypothetical protein
MGKKEGMVIGEVALNDELWLLMMKVTVSPCE